MADDDDDGPPMPDLSTLCTEIEKTEPKFKPPAVEEVLTYPEAKCTPTKENPKACCTGTVAPWYDELESKQSGVRDSGYSFALFKLDVKAAADPWSFAASGSVPKPGGDPTGSFTSKHSFESIPGLSLTERWKQDNTLGATLTYQELCESYNVSIEANCKPGGDKKDVGVKLGYRIPIASIKVDASSTGAGGCSLLLGSSPFYFGTKFDLKGQDQVNAKVVGAYISSCFAVAAYWNGENSSGGGDEEGGEEGGGGGEMKHKFGLSIWKRYCAGGIETVVDCVKETDSDWPVATLATKFPLGDAGTGRFKIDSAGIFAFSWQTNLQPWLTLTLSVKMKINSEGGEEGGSSDNAGGIALDFKL